MRGGAQSHLMRCSDGFYYVAEFGENNRISKWDADGKFVKCWGKAGTEPGQFQRVRALAIGPDGLLFCADALNNRIQVFTREGELVRVFGEAGTEPGHLGYPYDLAFAPSGELYVVEHENNRVQKFTAEGKSLGTWGGPDYAPAPCETAATSTFPTGSPRSSTATARTSTSSPTPSCWGSWRRCAPRRRGSRR